jgi:hypothetical protein
MGRGRGAVVSVQKRGDPRWWGAVGAYADLLVGYVLFERRLKGKEG